MTKFPLWIDGSCRTISSVTARRKPLQFSRYTFASVNRSNLRTSLVNNSRRLARREWDCASRSVLWARLASRCLRWLLVTFSFIASTDVLTLLILPPMRWKKEGLTCDHHWFSKSLPKEQPNAGGCYARLCRFLWRRCLGHTTIPEWWCCCRTPSRSTKAWPSWSDASSCTCTFQTRPWARLRDRAMPVCGTSRRDLCSASPRSRLSVE